MAIFGLALVDMFKKLDFPALGNPINPTSAIIFNSSHIEISSPSLPLVNFLGARLVELLNFVFPTPPKPPLAKINSSSSLVKS